MTISTTDSRISYNGNGVTTVFSFPYRFLANTDIVVVEVSATGVETTKALTTHYTMTGAGDPAGGSITMLTAPANGTTLIIYRDTEITQETDYVSGDPFPAETHEAALDRLTMIAQEDATKVARSIKVPVGDSTTLSTTLPAATDRLDRFLVFDATTGATELSTVTQTQVASAVAAAYAAGSTADAVTFIQSGTGAVSRTVQSKNRDLIHLDDFGADKTGATNATTAILNFFNECIVTGRPGHIPAGDYLVTAGVLAFDTPFVDAVWPSISTDGFEAVTFKRADATNAPMITLTNGTATSGAGKYWLGGALGGITFDQNGKATGSSQHGLSLRGVWGTHFGYMRGNDLGGSCVYAPEVLYSGNNPDPYANTFLVFDGIAANRCLRYALENQNWVGFTGCHIKILRVIECLLGGFYGLGAGNIVDITSMGSVKGWAFDDGTATANTGGSPSRFRLGIAELDDVQNGFRLNKMVDFIGEQVRFVNRYNFNATLNPGEGYWPRIGISIGGGVGPAAHDIKINAIWRIEAGGAKINMGSFTNLHSVASTQIEVDNYVVDNAAFGFTDSDLYANRNSSGTALVTQVTRPAMDDRIKVGALVRSTTANTIPNSGYAAAGSKLTFGTEIYDKGGYYDTGNSWFTVPYSGLYRVSGRICLAAAVGTRVRLAFATDVASVVAIIAQSINYQADTGAQHYVIDGVVNLTAGDRVFLMGDQNTGTATIAFSAPISATADLIWCIEAL